MRKSTIALLSLLVSSAAFAQQKPTGVYVFVSNLGYTESQSSGSHWEGGYGVGLHRMLTPHLSGEVTVSRESHLGAFVTFFPDRLPVTERRSVWTTPVDVTARYHFFTDRPWQPYIGAGARWIDPPALAGAARTVADATAGVIWQFRPSLGLRFDGKLMLDDHPLFTDRVNVAAGLSWRF